MKGRHFLIGPGVTCDVDALVNTRLLVQANSGAGKSWALRRLLEQTHGHLQQLVVDPEGEFPSLREKFDYVLAARQGGDTLADPRSAKLLAERLLELGVSAVVDVYELKAHERVRFVRVFLEALVDAPKKLWHPVLVVVDEAHVYAPQHGDAESAGAVIDLCTRGRKRGYCAVLATQRLSKLHKDAAAECNNKLIGRSALDVDMDRAGEELGFKKPDRQVLRELDAGEFYAFGPALCRTVTRVKVGPIQTTHPKAGSRLAGVVPPPSEQVKAVLSKLADLPAEAEAREKTIADLKRDLAIARRQLTEVRKEQPAPPVAPKSERVNVPVLTDADRELLRKVEATIAQRAKNASEILAAAESRADKLVQTAVAEYLNLTRQVSFDAAKELTTALDRVGVQKVLAKLTALGEPARPVSTLAPSRQTVARPSPPRSVSVVQPARRSVGADNGTGDLTGPEQRILDALAWLESIGVTEPEQPAVAFLARYRYGCGGFNNPKGALRGKGLIEYLAGDRMRLTDDGRDRANVPATVLSLEELHARVLSRLPKPEQRILWPLLQAYPESVSNEALAEAARYAHGTGGFNNPRGRLRSLGLIEYPQPGRARARDLLFLGGRS